MWTISCHLPPQPSPPQGLSSGEGPEGTAAGAVVTGSPGTAAVVPEFAVVEGLAAHGILGVHIGPILHQDLHTSQQAIAGSQVQGGRAMACLTVRYTTGQRVKGRGKGKGIR